MSGSLLSLYKTVTKKTNILKIIVKCGKNIYACNSRNWLLEKYNTVVMVLEVSVVSGIKSL